MCEENDVLAQVLEEARKDLKDPRGLPDKPPARGSLNITERSGRAVCVRVMTSPMTDADDFRKGGSRPFPHFRSDCAEAATYPQS
jgi:hypothetical protein